MTTPHISPKVMDMMSPSFATIEGRRIAFAEVSPSHPSGTILLLMGLANHRLSWYKQLPVFGREYRTIALDHRDTGDSDLAVGPYRIADLADDAAALLRVLSITKSHISMAANSSDRQMLGSLIRWKVRAHHADP